MGRPLLRTPELADRFVLATVVMLEDQGPNALRTRAVADAAGSSLAALNDLFGSKAGLFNAVALHGFSVLLEVLDGTTTVGEPRADIIKLCGALRRFATEQPELMAHMYSRPFASFNPTDHDLENATAIRRHFTNHVAALIGRDRSTTAVFDTAAGLVALLEGLTSQQRAGTLGTTAKTANRRWASAIELYLDGATVKFRTVG